MTQDQRNNAVCAYMGGPEYVVNNHIPSLQGKVNLLSLDDMRFHDSWDWLIPAWSKVRHEMTPGMIIAAIDFIDNADIDKLFTLISQVCIDWCKTKNLKL